MYSKGEQTNKKKHVHKKRVSRQRDVFGLQYYAAVVVDVCWRCVYERYAYYFALVDGT